MLILIALAVIVKRLFVGLDIDEQYSVATIYRLSCGDIPIKEAWEPHQTSSLVMVPFAFAFLKLTGGSEYLLLFLRLVGMLIETGVAVAWYSFFKEKAGKTPSFISAFLIFLVLPKFIQSPEFNNMQVWFFILSAIFLLKAFESSKAGDYVLASLFMVLEVLSYPSCLLVYLVFLAFVVAKMRRGTLSFIAPAIVIGAGMTVWLFISGAFSDLKTCISGILHDEAHSDGLFAKMISYFRELTRVFLFIAIYAAIALIICALIKLIKREKGITNGDAVRFVSFWTIVAFIDQIRDWFFGEAYLAYPNFCWLVLFTAGPLLFVKADEAFKDKWRTASRLVYAENIVAFFCVLLLTNLSVKATFVHLLPGGALTLMMLCYFCVDTKDCRAFGVVTVTAVFVTVLIGQVWFLRTSNEGRCENILFVRQKVTWGPAKGIYAAYMEGYELNCDNELLLEIVPAGSKVLYVGDNNLVYMIGDYEVCTPSTISTPGYGTNLLDYYDINPDKLPEYVVIKNGYYELEYKDATLGFLMTLGTLEELGENEFVRVYWFVRE